MKKLLSLLLAVLLCFSFCACNKSSASGKDNSYATEAEDTRYYVLNTSSKKYHKTNCSYLPANKNSKRILRIEMRSYPDYSPCQHCIF